MRPRLPLPSDRRTTFGVPDERLAVPDAGELAPDIARARERCRTATFALGAVDDPVLVEMVRLRNARFQHCNFCQSTRSPAARARGGTEDLYRAVDHYESSALSGRQKAALRLADRYLLRPGEPADDPGEDDHLREGEVVELVLRLMEYSSDKVMVALRLDLDEPRVMDS